MINTPWYEQIPNPGAWADVVLIVHALIIAFAIGMLVSVLIGGPRGWKWVRSIALRWLHLSVILVVVVQSLRGRYCPLTYWEDDLRRAAGQSAYDASFIDYWVSYLIYFELPGWVFQVCYGLFALLVAVAWWRWPPQRKQGTGDEL